MADIQPLKQPALKSLPMGQMYIAGRIASRRKINTKDGVIFLTVAKLPAPDAYSHPITIELRSKTAVGSPGEDWEGVIRVNGFPRIFNLKPDENGEIKTVHTAQIQLDVIEA